MDESASVWGPMPGFCDRRVEQPDSVEHEIS